MRFPLLARAATLAAVTLSLLLPLSLVSNKVAERRQRAEEVQRAFESETSGPQTLVGPLLALSCEETVNEERVVMRAGKEETLTETKTRACPTAYFTPRTLAVRGDVKVDRLHRGIYPIRLFHAALGLRGEFDWPGPPDREGAQARRWTGASIVVATGDRRGIKAVSPLEWGGRRIAFDAGRGGDDRRFSLEAPLGPVAGMKSGETLAYAFSLELAGTRQFKVGPVGDSSTIRLAGNWPHPSFTGAFSPDARSVGPERFEAAWKLTQYATGGRAAWQPRAGADRAPAWDKVAGFALADPVNVYSLSYRANEYGFLFVLFSFAALALAEAVAGVRLHPVQYALVGSALAVFFLLLIALAEHLAFGPAYALAATACALLLAFYLRAPLGTNARAALFLALFAALYGSLYALLQSEDHALLAGSLLVFGVLAAGMVATRRLDWHGLAARLRAGAAGQGATA